MRGGIIATSAQGDSTVWTCRSARNSFIMDRYSVANPHFPEFAVNFIGGFMGRKENHTLLIRFGNGGFIWPSILGDDNRRDLGEGCHCHDVQMCLKRNPDKPLFGS